jgi:AhpD family alkylhydroperoxidase
MQKRPSPATVSPGGYKAMRGLQDYVNGCGIEAKTLELVKLRASQINACAFCIAMHTQEARALGETDERMHLLNAWEEAGVFTEREKAAIAWTEALTLLADGGVNDELYAYAQEHFSERELSDLTYAVVAINGWNRLMVAFHQPPRLAKAGA